MTASAQRSWPRRWAGVVAWALWVLALLGLASVPWFDHLTREAGRPELTQLNASTIPWLLAILVATTVGALLASRLPRHPVGWLLLAVGLSVTGSGVADGYARYGLVARPGALPAARCMELTVMVDTSGLQPGRRPRDRAAAGQDGQAAAGDPAPC